MFELYIQSPQVLAVAQQIPAAGMLTFIHYLEDNGYSSKTIHEYLGAVIHVSLWKHQQSCSCTDITALDKANFIELHLPNCQCLKALPRNKKSCAAALSLWLREIVPSASESADFSEHDKLVITFDHYLDDIAGLSSATRLYRCRYAREFLKWTHTNQSIPLTSLTAVHLSTFICLRATQVSLATTAAIACSINSFLRFLSAQGLCQFKTELYVPRPKLLFRLPDKQALSVVELTLLLTAIDRHYPVGKRDYAITRCLADLGIRTADVAKLTLDSIDWRNKVITLAPGKSRKQHKLPIPNTLMAALIDYITNGRPQTKTRYIFVYHRAPFGQPVKPSTVRGIVRRAFSKAGFEPSQSQVHRLRHTMATRLLDNGVPLKIIADVLGHQCLDTITRYTFVNRQALQAIALPWPGETSS
jgi:site-specific recombinase XerD